MAKKKRKTLPSDFYEILRRGDIDEIKAVFDKCEITAYAGRCDLDTAYITMESQPKSYLGL